MDYHFIANKLAAEFKKTIYSVMRRHWKSFNKKEVTRSDKNGEQAIKIYLTY